MPTPAAMTLQLTSPAFKDGDILPERFTRSGGNSSPPLAWSGVPEGTKSLVVAFERTDTTSRTSTHWLVYDIPADQDSLPEGLPHGERTADGFPQGRNDFGNLGYDGPRADEGQRTFKITLHALDKRLSGVGARLSLTEINLLLSGHLLGSAQISVSTR